MSYCLKLNLMSSMWPASNYIYPPQFVDKGGKEEQLFITTATQLTHPDEYKRIYYSPILGFCGGLTVYLESMDPFEYAESPENKERMYSFLTIFPFIGNYSILQFYLKKFGTQGKLKNVLMSRGASVTSELVNARTSNIMQIYTLDILNNPPKELCLSDEEVAEFRKIINLGEKYQFFMSRLAKIFPYTTSEMDIALNYLTKCRFVPHIIQYKNKENSNEMSEL